MNFSLQYQKASAKATQALRIIKRTFKNVNKESFLQAYKSPHLEYCVQLGTLICVIQDINILEKVKHKLLNLH